MRSVGCHLVPWIVLGCGHIVAAPLGEAATTSPYFCIQFPRKDVQFRPIGKFMGTVDVGVLPQPLWLPCSRSAGMGGERSEGRGSREYANSASGAKINPKLKLSQLGLAKAKLSGYKPRKLGVGVPDTQLQWPLKLSPHIRLASSVAGWPRCSHTHQRSKLCAPAPRSSGLGCFRCSFGIRVQ